MFTMIVQTHVAVIRHNSPTFQQNVCTYFQIVAVSAKTSQPIRCVKTQDCQERCQPPDGYECKPISQNKQRNK